MGEFIWGGGNIGGSSVQGIAPSNMRIFTAKSDKGKAVISGQLPADTIYEGQLICTVKGVKILRRTDRFPEKENDGTLLADLKVEDLGEDRKFTLPDETSVTGTLYYYQAFPYSDTRMYNRNPANRLQYKPILREYLYGYDLTLADQEPSTRVSYDCEGVDNRSFTRAKMVFGNPGHFDYGSWPMVGGFMPKPVMLAFDGTVEEWLDPSDYGYQGTWQGKEFTRTGPSSVTNSTTANAMMQWPKIYTKRWESGGVYHFRCSDIREDDSWDCWCNYDQSNNVIPYFYTSIYFGSDVSGKMRSLSGKLGMVSQTTEVEIDYAQGNGTDWYTEVISDRLLISDLLVMIGKSTNSQDVFGSGVCQSSGPISSGTMDQKGMFWGSNDQVSGVKVFGMENYWGNIWRRIAGWVMVDGTQYIKLTRGTHDGSKVRDYNVDAGGRRNFAGDNYKNNYTRIDGSTPSGPAGGYISKMKTTPYGRFPYEANGSNVTYEADGLWNQNTGTMYARVSGDWASNFYVGLFYSDIAADASVVRDFIGAAISCKPSTVV